MSNIVTLQSWKLAKWTDTSRFSQTFPISIYLYELSGWLLQVAAGQGQGRNEPCQLVGMLDIARVPVENCTPGVVGRRQCHILSISQF